MNKLLLDTNVLVYSIDEDSRFFQRARKVFEYSDKALLTTTKNLAEFLSVVTKTNGYGLEPTTFNTKDFVSVKEITLLDI